MVCCSDAGSVYAYYRQDVVLLQTRSSPRTDGIYSYFRHDVVLLQTKAALIADNIRLDFRQ